MESGHAVMHRSHEPSDSELLAALDITENLVQSIYIIDRAKEESLKNVPKRR